MYQSHSYGQMPFAASPYPPSHGGFQYRQPPMPPAPAPVQHNFYMDPSTFRRDYMSRLAQLTFNSRPIIQNLSMIAQEYSRWADIVAQCLETHIRQVPPWLKLPAFYVLDAISKNVYEPYARHFAGLVVPLFLETYQQVDQDTREKMIEMLATWRDGAPHGKELFGAVPQIAIERGIGLDPLSSNSVNGFYSGSGQISKAQVLSELQAALAQKQRLLLTNPYDNGSQTHVNVLQQLRKLVETGVSQEELKQILNQLRTLVRPGATLAPGPSSTPVHASPPLMPQLYSQPPFPVNQYPSVPPQPNFAPAPGFSPASLAQYGAFQAPKSETVEPSVPPYPAPASGSSASNITNLFNALVKAGVVSTSTTTSEAGAVTATQTEEKGKEGIKPDEKRESIRKYRREILRNTVTLTTANLARKRPDITRFLYDFLPSQCKQCGVRFTDDPIGKKAMENHLDTHFRQNRKATQNVGRGHSRSWFIAVEDWIYDVRDDGKGKERVHGRRMNAQAALAAEAAQRDTELRAQFVVVPPGDEAKSISCPICKEILKSEFLEDDEEWVWKNAVKKDDRVYHATCHAEALASTYTLAARLRNEAIQQRSRSATPETSSRSTPPKNLVLPASKPLTGVRGSLSPPPELQIAGTKRKVEHTDAALSGEAGGSPALKKMAIASPA